MTRGFAVVALEGPKFGVNIGGVFRACGNYDAAMMVVARPRCDLRQASDTMKTIRHKPLLRVEDVFDALPFDCVPVAVDLLPTATPIMEYEHPERAFYIFGAEDQTIGHRITSRCRDVIYVPTRYCMNLAATVNVVLFDRATKRREWPVAHEAPEERDSP